MYFAKTAGTDLLDCRLYQPEASFYLKTSTMHLYDLYCVYHKMVISTDTWVTSLSVLKLLTLDSLLTHLGLPFLVSHINED